MMARQVVVVNVAVVGTSFGFAASVGITVFAHRFGRS